MTKHASRHANSVTRKSNHTLNSNHTRNPWSVDYQHSANAVSSSNSSQTRAPVFRTLSGPGPPPYAADNVSELPQRHYHPHHRARWHSTHPYAGSVTMPRPKSQKVNVAPCGERMATRTPSLRSSVSATAATNNAIAMAATVTTAPAPASSPPPPPPPAAGYRDRQKFCDPIVAAGNSGCSTSRTSSDRPATPLSLSTTDGIVDPCGGHCRTFERCCHYVLQALFIMGILVGVSLVLAAYWLHNQRRSGDKLVLVYIGVLMALVCILLLSIQCSAEREVKRKKRSKRATAALVSRNRHNPEVPMRTLNGNRYVYASREAEDAITGPQTYCEMPLLYNPYYYESQTRSCDEMSQSQNGTFWWRRYGMEVTSKNDNIV